MTSKKRRRVPESNSPNKRRATTKPFFQNLQNFQNLKKLPSLSISLTLRDLDLWETSRSEVFKVYPDVGHLDVRGCVLSGGCCKDIGDNWKLLSTVNFSYTCITDSELACLFDNGKISNLSVIDLSYTKISDLGVRYIAEHCPKLTNINLKGCNITDSSLSDLAKFCKNIAILNVSENDKISDYGIQIVAQEAKNNLKYLNVNDSPEITDQTMYYLYHYCDKLTSLLLRGTKVSKEVISQLIGRFELRELNLQGLRITDDVILEISSLQKNLVVLDVSFCYDISISSIKLLIERCEMLREVHLFGINFSDLETEELSKFEEKEQLTILQ